MAMSIIPLILVSLQGPLATAQIDCDWNGPKRMSFFHPAGKDYPDWSVVKSRRYYGEFDLFCSSGSLLSMTTVGHEKRLAESAASGVPQCDWQGERSIHQNVADFSKKHFLCFVRFHCHANHLVSMKISSCGGGLPTSDSLGGKAVTCDFEGVKELKGDGKHDDFFFNCKSGRLSLAQAIEAPRLDQLVPERNPASWVAGDFSGCIIKESEDASKIKAQLRGKSSSLVQPQQIEDVYKCLRIYRAET